MMYQSTRDHRVKVSAAQAIAQGISKEGGLFVPETLPSVSMDEIRAMANESYVCRANRILSRFLTDFTKEELEDCTVKAYTGGRFAHPDVAPLAKLTDGVYMLELWHGPTCAFKDMALQILPHLMRVSASKAADGQEVVILVATSGDTGKAALEGFRDAEHTRIMVFYPEDGVSPMQKLQMVTQEGNNVAVCAIRGNFDDAQTGVKTIFTDPAMADLLKQHGKMFSSANSINWGRLVPQIVYYFSAYADMLKHGALKAGEPMNVVVPTGNFGNILAAYYAKQMGLPIGKFICASNSNRVLTDFIRTGTYDRNREFYLTSSPSMDILVSSNLERLLFALYGEDDTVIADLMNSLSKTGVYTVSDAVKTALQQDFYGGCCDDTQTAKTIADYFNEKGYLMDTHTAVAVNVYEQYRAETGDATPTVIASTANPYKFSASVLEALGVDMTGMDEFDKVEALNKTTAAPIPTPLASLSDKQVRFEGVCDKDGMADAMLKAIGIR